MAVATAPATADDPFAGFIVGLRDVCAEQPARNCTQRVSKFLDSDSTNGVSLQEFEAVRTQAKSAVAARDSGLSNAERSILSISLLAFQQVKLADVFAKFDSDKNGGLSEGELFADFKLDQRPMAKIISDPASVDWNSLAARFGEVGFLLLDLLPPGHRK
ncbi:MAG: hypothetical protein OER92_03900 [Alphaproteobacteria bacterium]|nr:hypothetical protein [Alphaproteobacteria bacterium]